MELFIIQCTTCRARLKVNDESVIGDILGCPKCGSMVQVVPPVDWKRAAAPLMAAQSTAAQPAVAALPPTQPTSKAAAVLPPMLPLPAAATLESPRAIATSTSVIHSAGSLGAGLVTRIKQDWILLGCGLAAGVVLGAGAWLTINWGSADQQVAIAAQADNANRHGEKEAAPAHPWAPIEQPEAAKVAAAEPSAPPEPVGDPEIEAPATVERPVAEAPRRVALKPDATEPADPPPADEARAPAIKLEPVEKRPNPPAAQPDVAASPANEPTAGEPQGVPPTTPKPPADTTSSTADTGIPKLTSEEIDERLGGPLPVVRFVNVPLAQFVEFISNFAGLPITIDDAALAKAGKKRETPVTLRLKDTTARDALTSAVNSLGLKCAVREGRLVVTAKK